MRTKFNQTHADTEAHTQKRKTMSLIASLLAINAVHRWNPEDRMSNAALRSGKAPSHHGFEWSRNNGDEITRKAQPPGTTD